MIYKLTASSFLSFLRFFLREIYNIEKGTFQPDWTLKMKLLVASALTTLGADYVMLIKIDIA